MRYLVVERVISKMSVCLQFKKKKQSIVTHLSFYLHIWCLLVASQYKYKSRWMLFDVSPTVCH